MCGASIPEDRWFTNLYTRGNTGAASILIMMDEFLRGDRAQVGDTVLCMVPESGRFNTAYMHFTLVES
jgi:3-oxoacyl-[acyl-carrier-protein] synthase-3